jgi:two-component system, LytTR family, response regulator LytT
MPFTVAIIEDEPAIARNLQFLLEDVEPNMTILRVLGSVAEAVDWLRLHAAECDLLFMDIQLSDGQSFDIFHQLSLQVPVIFVTAFNDYALHAFKANGIDYILKPYDQEDIRQAFAKFRRLSKADHLMDQAALLRHLAESLKAVPLAYKQSFLVHFREKMIPLAANDIAWFYTANELVYATTIDRKRHLIDFTMEQLQQQLDPGQFFRANRQFIVQRKAIREMESYFNGRILIKMAEEAEENIIVSKARVPELKTWMNT